MESCFARFLEGLSWITLRKIQLFFVERLIMTHWVPSPNITINRCADYRMAKRDCALHFNKLQNVIQLKREDYLVICFIQQQNVFVGANLISWLSWLCKLWVRMKSCLYKDKYYFAKSVECLLVTPIHFPPKLCTATPNYSSATLPKNVCLQWTGFIVDSTYHWTVI